MGLIVTKGMLATATALVLGLAAGCSTPMDSDGTSASSAPRGANPAASDYPNPGEKPQGGAIANAARTPNNGMIVQQQLVFDFLLYSFVAGGPPAGPTDAVSCAGTTAGSQGYCFGFGEGLNQTWRYNSDGMVWSQVQSTKSPDARNATAMSMSPSAAGDGALLLGGQDPASGTPLTDTWLVSGDQWQQLCQMDQCGLDKLIGITAAGDGTVALAFGGQGVGSEAAYSDSLQQWDAAAMRWQSVNVAGTGPSPRADAAFAYVGPDIDSGAGGSFLLFGGRDATGALSDTWLLSQQDGVWSWDQVTTEGPRPAPRQNAGLAGSFQQNSQYSSGGILIGGWSGDAKEFELYSDGWTFNPKSKNWSCSQNGQVATDLTTGNFAAYAITAMTLRKVGDEVFTWVEYDPAKQDYIRMTQDNRLDTKAIERELADERRAGSSSPAASSPAQSATSATKQTCNAA